MRSRPRMFLLFGIVCATVFLFMTPVEAAKPLAKITGFSGEVAVLSDFQFTRVSKTGLVLNEGDKIQTKDGWADVTFDDGSILKLSSYTSAMIQEREEQGGKFFKNKTTARRLTVFVGRLWFSSGSSHKKNLLQTPTAVCGLRGSVAEIGYDNIKSFLNVISGDSQVIGQFVRGVFANPGISAALKNEVFNRLAAAGQTYDQAQKSGAVQDMVKAELSGLQAIKTAAEALKNNPDKAVANQAVQALNAVNARIEEKQKLIQQLPPAAVPPATTPGATTTRTRDTTTTIKEMRTTKPLPTITFHPRPSISVTTTTRILIPSTTVPRPVSPYTPN